MSDILVKIKKENRTIASPDFRDTFKDWKAEQEKWLFISPHDDDAVIGGGLLIQKAAAGGIPLQAAVVTDGVNGYCSFEQKDSIVSIREKEASESFRVLSVNYLSFLGYPDGNTAAFSGRRKAVSGDPDIISGFTGMQNSFTALLRKFRPTRLFIMSGSDYHPDHRLVYQEALISVFHAAGAIWPELGSSLEDLPVIYEMAAYCNFNRLPDIQISSDMKYLDRKIDALRSYKSQTGIIEVLVDNLKNSGPYEYFIEHEFDLYDPAVYRKHFE